MNLASKGREATSLEALSQATSLRGGSRHPPHGPRTALADPPHDRRTDRVRRRWKGRIMPGMPPPLEFDLDDAVALYLDHCEAEGFAASTLALYRIVLRQFVAFAERQGHTRTTDLTLELALAWQRYLRTEQVNDRGRRRGTRTRRLAPHTVHGYCRTLRTFAGWLADYTDLSDNPLAKLRPGRLPKKDVQPLSDEEHRRIIESLDPRSATGLRNLALVSILLDTGLRASELCHLRLDDLNLATGEVRVLHGKGAKDRVVALGRRSRAVVARYIHVYRKAGEFDAGPRAPLFLSFRGRPLKREALARIVAKIGQRAGVEPLYPHRFRHTFGVAYLRAGGDVLTLQRILGHSTLVMVNHYLHLATSDVVARHQAHSPVDRLPDFQSFRRLPRRRRARGRARIVAAEGGAIVIQTEAGQLLEVVG